jgi:hypothetical protein
VSFASITFCVASQRVFIVLSVYFVIDSVRKVFNTPSYTHASSRIRTLDPCNGALQGLDQPPYILDSNLKICWPQKFSLGAWVA